MFKIQSFEMVSTASPTPLRTRLAPFLTPPSFISIIQGVLFLPSRYRRLAVRSFSCTPTHPLLGLSSPGHTDVTAFVSASCQSAK